MMDGRGWADRRKGKVNEVIIPAHESRASKPRAMDDGPIDPGADAKANFFLRDTNLHGLLPSKPDPRWRLGLVFVLEKQGVGFAARHEGKRKGRKRKKRAPPSFSLSPLLQRRKESSAQNARNC